MHAATKRRVLSYFGAPLGFIFGRHWDYLLRFARILGLHGYQWMFMLQGHRRDGSRLLGLL